MPRIDATAASNNLVQGGLLTESTGQRKRVVCYTDGACLGNPGPGGYGAILIYGLRRKELSGGYQRTTNNRMEVLAAIVALEILREPCDVVLHSDSQYLVNAVTKGWIKSWRAKGWKLATGQSAANVDLWERLSPLLEKHHVEFRWVKGHAGDVENERADRLAMAGAQTPNHGPDEGYQPENRPPASARRWSPR
jgi:ribonuclease HI